MDNSPAVVSPILSAEDQSWLSKLNQKTKEFNETIVFPIIRSLQMRNTLLPLPLSSSTKARTNEHLQPSRNNDTIPDAQRNCQKRPGQRFWAATYATGAKREKIAEEVTKPTCLAADYRARNTEAFSLDHGVGMWIWKSYVQYLAMGRMNDGDIVFYLDSDMGCTTLEYS